MADRKYPAPLPFGSVNAMDLGQSVGQSDPRAITIVIMKKSTKSAKTPAPATKPAEPAPQAAVPVAAKKSPVAPKIKPPSTPVPAPAVVAKPKGARVTIIAEIDVGFGNFLAIRGDEPALHWAKGLPLGNISDGKWEIVLTGIERPFEFKFLVNDVSWSVGENFTASPGDTLTLSPGF